MTPIREAFVLAASSATGLIADPAVAAAWSEPSALEGFTVGGLAGHLAAQALFVPDALRMEPPGGDVVPLLGHYDRVKWIDAGIDAEVNVGIRSTGEGRAEAGADALVDTLASTVDTLGLLLAAEPEDRLVAPPAGPWALRLDDFLVTRMMEIAVHSDDLAFSVGVPTPELPPSVMEPVLLLLTALSARRHGMPALLRALTRAERAPQAVNAF
jgi:hypothetical protein